MSFRREPSHLSRGLVSSGKIVIVRAPTSALKGLAEKESQARTIMNENQDNPFINGTLFNQEVKTKSEVDIFDARLKSNRLKKTKGHYPFGKTLLKIFISILAIAGTILFAFLVTYLVLQVI